LGEVRVRGEINQNDSDNEETTSDDINNSRMVSPKKTPERLINFLSFFF